MPPPPRGCVVAHGARGQVGQSSIMRPSFTLVPLVALGVLACDDHAGPTEPLPPGAPAAVTVLVPVNSPGARIPADFLGLGFEMPVMADPRLRGGNPALERLLAGIGPGTLRFGGNSVERTLWAPARRPTPGFFALTPADVDAVFAFARRIGWRVTVALNLGVYDPEAAADETAYLVGAGGDALLGVEIGNEPNLYPLSGLRSDAWTVDSFTVEFDRYAAAIQARVPSALLAGPTTWCTGGGEWFAQFLDRRRTTLAFASHHFYPMGASAPAGSAEEATVANMLSPELMARTRDCVDSAAGAAASHGLALRVDETNSAFGFGQPGVSDVFASALWGVDHLFTLAELGVSAVNIQTGTDRTGGLTCEGIYLPFCGEGHRYTARPLYYAMLLFHQAGVGRTLPAQVKAAEGANVATHAVLGEDGGVRVVLINKEGGTAAEVSVTISSGSDGDSARVMRLEAPSLSARSGVTLGGSGVAEDGGWTPGPLEPVKRSGGIWRLSLPAASAALLFVWPGLPAPCCVRARSLR
jgi:hypothetical protein